MKKSILIGLGLVGGLTGMFFVYKAIKKFKAISDEKYAGLKKEITEKVGKINTEDAEKFLKKFNALTTIIASYSRKFLNNKFKSAIEDRRKVLKDEKFQEYSEKIYQQIIEAEEYSKEFNDKGLEYAGLTNEKLNETMNRTDVKLQMNKLNPAMMSPPDDSDISIAGITSDQCIEMFFYITNHENEEMKATRYVMEAIQKKIPRDLPPEQGHGIFMSFQQNFLSDCLYNKYGIDLLQYEKAARHFKLEDNERVKEQKERMMEEAKRMAQANF